MIAKEYLAVLRGQVPAAPLLTLVQLEQLCPGWWNDLSDLALELNLCYDTVSKNLTFLRRKGLIKYHAELGPTTGCWVWWVKRHADDQPRAKDEPAWKLLNVKTLAETRVPVSRRHSWAKARNIPRSTLAKFLRGDSELLRSEWRIVSSPV